MTAAEAKALADSKQAALETADFDKVMALIVAEAEKGNYELSYLEVPLKSTGKKLQDPPNLYSVKNLWDNENRYLVKW